MKQINISDNLYKEIKELSIKHKVDIEKLVCEALMVYVIQTEAIDLDLKHAFGELENV